MADIDVKKKQFEDLKAAYRLFGQGDLMKFWLFEEHRCIDKWINYFPVYEKWFAPYRGKDIVFVEVGVQNGGSAQMWRNYFGKDAKIVGVDIDQNCKKLEAEGISVEIGSQSDPKFWAAFKEKYPRVDILLDDGGLYMCEDCHTSYWESFGGGLEYSGSFVEFSKRLVDEINAYWTGNKLKPNYNTQNIGGVHFYTSMVVVEKNERAYQPFALQIGELTVNRKEGYFANVL